MILISIYTTHSKQSCFWVMKLVVNFFFTIIIVFNYSLKVSDLLHIFQIFYRQ